MRAAGILSAVALLLIGSTVRADLPAPPKKVVDFETEVRPIFAAACYSCHGPQKQKSNFRLDRKTAALKGGDNGPAIVPGKSADSPMIQRVASSSKDERMPPTGSPLTAAHVAILRAWIDQGAKWPDAPIASDKPHWAYLPLTRPPTPTGGTNLNVHNPIDVFVLAKLKEKGLTPSPPADRRAWIRRVTFDLIGMPPTPEEVRDFLADSSPNAHEKVADRLLASPHYGERWARHWMDVAHFAESHGNDQDRPRPNAWPYRDYLIRSLNDDKPYGRFVAEQVAGDVLFPDDPWATAALGFLAAGPWDESSLRDIVADTVDNRIAQVLDRDDMLTTVMTTFVGATVNCARCHNHKFDPISQEDYYALQAVFAGVGRAERPFDTNLAVHSRRHDLLARRAALEKGPGDRELFSPDAQARVAHWEQSTKGRHGVWRVLNPDSFTAANGSKAARQPDGSLLYGGPAPERDTYFITVRAESPVTAVRLEVMSDPSLPMKGPGRQDNGNLHLSEFRVLVWPGFGFPPVPVPIKQASADFNQDGWTINHAIDGNSKTAWGIYPEVGRTHSAVFELPRPMPAGRGAVLTVVLSQLHGGHHLIGRPRLSATSAEKPSQLQPIPGSIAVILEVPADQRDPKQRADLARYVLRSEVDAELTALSPPPMVYAAAHDFKPEGSFRPSPKPRPVHVLRRGDILSPMAAAQPGTLACVSGLPSRFSAANADDEGARRAALARWLTDQKNVLTWRSIVNRVWHYHFGRGIVDTPNDFGRMGGTPSHPELLDWLAVEFRDGGGSLKALHKMIVLSAAYGQSSQVNEMYAKVDGDNRLLWRMNRTRLDSESVRDAVLCINGRLDQKMGGPSVKQFIQTPGIHVTPNVDYASFNVDDPAIYRRSVYRFHFRTLPDPFLEALDQPDSSQQTPVRAESVTPLQALAMLNDKFMVRQCEHLADRLAKEEGTRDEQVRRLFDLALNRPATAHEVELLTAHAAKYGMVNACRVVFNSNEFMFVP